MLSEQHPREQGLKQCCHKEKKEMKFRLSEQHPREQGLKLSLSDVVSGNEVLSEQHPREQGLKL